MSPPPPLRHVVRVRARVRVGGRVRVLPKTPHKISPP